MVNRLLIGTAITALMVSGALAQTPNSTPPAAATPSTPSASTPSTSTPAAPSANQSATGTPNFVHSQKPDQWLASKFKGTDVLGSDDKKIGAVSDVLFDKEGKVEAYIVSVGGFLGMGAKEVALAPASFTVVTGKNGGSDQLKVAASTDELKQAQNFERYTPPASTTTGSGATSPMSSPAGSGGALRPSTAPSK